MIDNADHETYRVVINEEAQYSIWPAAKPIPPGWKDAGMTGVRSACLEHIRTHWTDLRPMSLRKAMSGQRE